MAEKQTPAAGTGAHFLRRRDTWIRWVVESDLPPAARVIGVHLAMRMSVRKQSAWPNVKTMARLLDMSARHVSRGLASLDDFGALAITRDRGRGNEYRLRLPTDP